MRSKAWLERLRSLRSIGFIVLTLSMSVAGVALSATLASASTIIGQPTNLTATPGPGEAVLTWQAPSVP